MIMEADGSSGAHPLAGAAARFAGVLTDGGMASSPVQGYGMPSHGMTNMLPEIQKAIQKYFTTGYPVLDVFVCFLVVSIMMQLVSGTFDIHGKFHRLMSLLFTSSKRTRHRGEIEFKIESAVGKLDGLVFTPAYKAIMHRLSQIEDERVWHLKEQEITWYDNQEYKNVTETLYEVLQDNAIEVEPYVMIQCRQQRTDRPNPRASPSGENNRLAMEEHLVHMYSDKLTARELQEVTNRWLKDYKAYKRRQLKDKQLIFMVRFSDRDNNSEDIKYVDFHTFRTFDNLFFEEKAHLLTEIDFFLYEKPWYQKRGLPDSLGILCHGPPGCGKTSFIKALLKYTKRHGIVFSINRNTSLDVLEKLMRTDTIADFPIPQDERIYVLEDIDAMGDIVAKRKNSDDDRDRERDEKQAKQKADEKAIEEELLERQLLKFLKFGLSKSSEQHLGFLLNLLDGLVESKGRIVIMTTNHISKLDPALIRPGRIDLNIEFKKCTRNVLKEILNHFFKMEDIDWELPPEIKDHMLSPATIAQHCRAFKHDFDGVLESLRREAQKITLGKTRSRDVEAFAPQDAKGERKSRWIDVDASAAQNVKEEEKSTLPSGPSSEPCEDNC